MSGLGPSRRFDHAPATSGLPPSTDILRVRRHVSKVPEAAIPLFDHLVGEGEQRRWNRQAERFRCLEINSEQVLGGLFNR